MTDAEMVVALTRHIRDAVRPHLGAARSRVVSGVAASGDATFAIDVVAEDAIVSFVEREKLAVAYYSEDKGLVEFGKSPEAVLVVDPIDGTRPAMAGLETCVVSVALADYAAGATLGDVRHGCIGEIKSDEMFAAERGRGAKWIGEHGAERELRLLPVEDVRLAPISFELVARPFEWLGVALGEIVNAAGFTGGCFVFNSTAFSLTRLVTGQLAGVLDAGNRIFRELPGTRARFRELGSGNAIGLFPYDIAAAALIASEAGATVTDASGRGLDATPLLDTSEGNLNSILAVSNPVLHERLLAMLDIGVARLAAELSRTQA